MIINVMIDFVNIVDLVLEQDASISTTESDEVNKSGVDAFLQNYYKPLQTMWSQLYKDYPFVTPEEFSLVAYKSMESSKRNVKGSSGYPKFKSIFPLLDLFGLLAKDFQKGGNPKNADATYKKFLSNLDKYKNSPIPLDYVPILPWAMTVKQDYFSQDKGEIGALRLDTLNPNLSLYYVIQNLLAKRKQSVVKKMPDQEKNFFGEKFVDDILLRIPQIISGQLPVRDQKISKIYDEGASRALMSVAIAAYKLYKEQLDTYVGQQDPSNAESLAVNEQVYAQFLGVKDNAGAKPIIWKQFIKESTTNPFEFLCLEILNEMNVQVPASNAMFSFSGDSTAEPTVEETVKPFQNKPGEEFVYNFGNLKKAADDNLPTAKALLEALSNLANYIKSKAEFDVLGTLNKITNVAQGAMLGAKMMGS